MAKTVREVERTILSLVDTLVDMGEQGYGYDQKVANLRTELAPVIKSLMEAQTQIRAKIIAREV